MTFGSEEIGLILLSLRIACVAVAVSLPFAIGTALILTRRPFWGQSALNIAVHLPLVLPPVVTGYALLVLFSPNALLGRWLEVIFGTGIAFRWTGAALAAAIMAFPLFVRAIRQSLEAVDGGLQEAALTLGRSRLGIFFTITLPLCWPGILAGIVLAWAKALGEFGATITFVSNIPGQTQTIPTAIYSALQVPGDETAALALILVSVTISAGALIASEWLARSVGRRLAQ